MRAAVCAIARDEGLYLHEWIAYHRVLGFDDILVFDHESQDGSTQLLAELAGHGLVTPVPWSVAEDVSPQHSAYADGLRRLGDDYGWVAFLDLDEFLVLPRHAGIHDFLAEYADRDAIAVNWRMFGSSGEDRYRPEPVIDRFRRSSSADAGRNRRVKPLARTDRITGPATPHRVPLLHGAVYADIAGRAIRNGKTESTLHDTIRLNHYYTKSLEEWRWKQSRGRGGKPANAPEAKYAYPDFESRDVGDDVERDIVARLPAVLDLVRRTPTTTEVARPATTTDRVRRMRARPGEDGRYRGGVDSPTLRLIREDLDRHLPSLTVRRIVAVGATADEALPGLQRHHPAAEVSVLEPADDATTGDAFCAEEGIDRVDYLRLDVLGQELEVLRGFAGLLAAGRVGIVELAAGLAPEVRRPVSFERLKGYLEPMGYAVFGIYEQAGERRRPRLASCRTVFASGPVVEADTRRKGGSARPEDDELVVTG